MSVSQGRRPLRIALVGTRGVPARYGGFETCIEEVGGRLVEAGHEVVVYCRTGTQGPDSLVSCRGMELVHRPTVHTRQLETLVHTGLSVLHLLFHRTDVAIVFNAANAVWLPLLRVAGIPVATHVDGLEWRRAKWGAVGRRYYRVAEALAVRWSEAIIADARGIQDYYAAEFGVSSELIAYGAPLLEAPGADRLSGLGLVPGEYHLVVARFEPENHVHVIVDGFTCSSAEKPLVVVGSAPYSDEYTQQVHATADSRVRFLGAVWDQETLDQLYANCCTYVHGHSVGGTNPSLLRAIGAGAAVLAFDVSFNREVLGDAGWYFDGPESIAECLEHAEGNPDDVLRHSEAARVAAGRYRWEDVAVAYEALCRKLQKREFVRARRSRRRRTPSRTRNQVEQ